MIEGLKVTPLRSIPDPRGDVLHMLRCDSPLFKAFGEVYFSKVNPGAVKAWKRHKLMTQNLAVPVGSIRLVAYDDRPGSPTAGQVVELAVGEAAYALVQIPPMVWYGFEGLSPTSALIANCADLPHDPAEVDRREPTDAHIPYQWGRT